MKTKVDRACRPRARACFHRRVPVELERGDVSSEMFSIFGMCRARIFHPVPSPVPFRDDVGVFRGTRGHSTDARRRSGAARSARARTTAGRSVRLAHDEQASRESCGAPGQAHGHQLHPQLGAQSRPPHRGAGRRAPEDGHVRAAELPPEAVAAAERHGFQGEVRRETHSARARPSGDRETPGAPPLFDFDTGGTFAKKPRGRFDRAFERRR